VQDGKQITFFSDLCNKYPLEDAAMLDGKDKPLESWIGLF